MLSLFSTQKGDAKLFRQKESALLRPIFFNTVGPVAEIRLLLNQMCVFVFGVGSYLPAAAVSLITNEVQRDEAAVSASYLVFSKSSVELVMMPLLIKLFESLSSATISYSLSARQPLFVIISRMVCGM